MIDLDLKMLGDRLSELRRDFGYTQEDLALLLKINRSSISNYEQGINEPSLSTIVKLANLYNVSTDYLLCRTKEKNNFNLLSKDHKELILRFNNLLNEYNISKK